MIRCSVKDPDELLREIEEKQRSSLIFVFKRLLRLTVGAWLIQLRRWMFNKCVKCGTGLVMYRTHNNKKIKVCERCDLINPHNIIIEKDILPNGEVVNRRVYPGRLNRYVYVIIVILVFTLLRWSTRTSKKEFRRDQHINNEQDYMYPIYEEPEQEQKFIN